MTLSFDPRFSARTSLATASNSFIAEDTKPILAELSTRMSSAQLKTAEQKVLNPQVELDNMPAGPTN